MIYLFSLKLSRVPKKWFILSIIEKYLDADKEVMLAGSDMTKSGGFFSAQYTLFNFMSNVKKYIVMLRNLLIIKMYRKS